MNKLQDEKLPETLEGGEITSYEIDSNNDPIIPEIRLFDDLIIDEEGVEYKGERIDDAGKVYWALLQVLYGRGYRDKEFRTPPPFIQCSKCGGTGYIAGYPEYNPEIDDVPECPMCKDSSVLGHIQRYYTPEQYRDWIRRENNMPDYELPNDMPIWAEGMFKKWLLMRVEDYEGPDSAAVVATVAGRPQKR
jgi:hypothetical protein